MTTNLRITFLAMSSFSALLVAAVNVTAVDFAAGKSYRAGTLPVATVFHNSCARLCARNLVAINLQGFDRECGARVQFLD